MKSKAELAKEFTINDVFLVNHAMVHAEEKYKEAWNRVRAKLLISAEIPTPAITITNLEVVSGSNPNKFNPELVEAVEEFIAEHDLRNPHYLPTSDIIEAFPKEDPEIIRSIVKELR